MALARTTFSLQESALSFGTGVYTTAAFTPPDNSLLVIPAYFMETGGSGDPSADMTITDSVGLTWSSRVAIGNTTSFVLGIVIWTAPLTTGVSMTVSVDAGARSAEQWTVHRYAYTGYDTGSPTGVVASSADIGTDGAQSITLSGAPASESEVVAILGQEMSGNVADETAVTHGTGWTEIYESPVDTDFNHSQSQVRTGSTSTTVGWDDISAGLNTPAKTIAAALEIKAAAASISLTPTVGAAALIFIAPGPVTGIVKSPLTP